MPTKNRIRSTANPAPSTTTARPSKRIVNAVVFNTPDLSLYLKLQNLLNYFIDCMNNLTSPTDHNFELADHLARCIQHINDVHTSGTTTFDNELQVTLSEFLDDAHQFEHLVASFTRPHGSPRPTDQSAAVLLTAKASHLQWLSVCILEDLKKSHFPV